MPGVIVKTTARSGPASSAAPADARYFVAGLTERGDVTNPIRVRSAAELDALCGGPVTYGAVWEDVRTFLSEGGGEAFIARVVGPAATVGTLTLMDRAAVTPVATLAIDAQNPGAWSSRLTVAVENGTAANTFRLRFALDGVQVEVHDNLANPAAAVDALAARSTFARARNLGSATVAPGNNPAVLAATALSAGNDDRAAVTATTVGNALARFAPGLGAGAVAAPGYPSSALGAALRAHAVANRRIALTATAAGATVAEAVTAAEALTTNDGDAVGLFYPWVRVPTGVGTSKLISPEGYVAAVRNRAWLEAGPWRAPAGEIATARYVEGPERQLSRAEGDQLDDAGVSAIRTIAGSTRLYGWRSLSSDRANFTLLTGRDVLNLLAWECERRLEQFVFQTIDGRGHLLGDVEAELIGLLDPLRLVNGLYERVDEDGSEIDPGYSVDVGPSVNTSATLAANEVRANVAVRVSPVGSLITVTITKAAVAATV